MKRLQTTCVLLLAAFVASGTAAIHSGLFSYKEGQRFFYAPGKDGKLQLVDLTMKEDIHARKFFETDINYYLFTRKNPIFPENIVVGDGKLLENSFFDKKKATKIIIHGWNNDLESEINVLVKDSFLSVLDVNVIVMDWSGGSGGLYTTAVGNAVKAGEWLGGFLDWLGEEGHPPSRLHLVGYSLGAHVAGIAARLCTAGRVSYITGLDPAGPLWPPHTERIRPSDADYVEIIHTDAGSLGLYDAVGDNDFYPNAGSKQPGCSWIDIGCSHSRSYQYFADSLDHQGFMAEQCNDVVEVVGNECSGLSKLYMGGSKVKEARGVFYLETSADEPYYLG